MPETTASSRKKSDRFFRRLLRLYPADFRAAWGGEMEELFTARRRCEPIRRLLWEVTLDTFKTAPKEHLAMLIQDIKHALRGLRNNPGFTAVAILSLALGIGANSSIFSMANALLLRPLPVPESSHLLIIEGTSGGESLPQNISHPDYLELRAQSKSFQSIAASSETRFGFASRPEEAPQLKLGAYVSANFSDVLGVPPALGRGFRPDEDEAPARDAVAIESHALWTDDFQADPSVLGRKILLNGVELIIVGVAAEGFGGLRSGVSVAVYVPIMMFPALAPTPVQAIPGPATPVPFLFAAAFIPTSLTPRPMPKS